MPAASTSFSVCFCKWRKDVKTRNQRISSPKKAGSRCYYFPSFCGVIESRGQGCLRVPVLSSLLSLCPSGRVGGLRHRASQHKRSMALVAPTFQDGSFYCDAETQWNIRFHGTSAPERTRQHRVGMHVGLTAICWTPTAFVIALLCVVSCLCFGYVTISLHPWHLQN